MHIRNDHSYFLRNPEKILKNNDFTCKVCSKCFIHRGSLYNHLRRIHKVSNIGLKTVKCQEKNCFESFKTTTKLMTHLSNQHDESFILEELIFESFDDFKIWKRAMEKETKADYICYSQKFTPNDTLVYYKCSRSGFYKEKRAAKERKRRLKSQGSKKSGAHCTSKITLNIDCSTKKVKVRFCKTHYGHKVDVMHLKDGS